MSITIDKYGTTEVDIQGTIRHYNLEGQLHQDKIDKFGYTLPAVEYVNVNGLIKIWCKNNKLHRDDCDPITGMILPAVEHYNGNINGKNEWYINGVKYILIKI